MKLLPYSEYVALAISDWFTQKAEVLILKYYGEANLPDRVIKLGFSIIADLMIGDKEKILTVTDMWNGILAQYKLSEIGCPSKPEVTSCNPVFMDQDVKCGEDPNLVYNLSLKKCLCKAGYFREGPGSSCRQC